MSFPKPGNAVSVCNVYKLYLFLFIKIKCFLFRVQDSLIKNLAKCHITVTLSDEGTYSTGSLGYEVLHIGCHVRNPRLLYLIYLLLPLLKGWDSDLEPCVVALERQEVMAGSLNQKRGN